MAMGEMEVNVPKSTGVKTGTALGVSIRRSFDHGSQYV
jgi:hypothetical protein